MVKWFRFRIRMRIHKIHRFCKRLTVRSIIGNTSRCIGRICTYLCTIDSMRDAPGLADWLVPPVTDERKAEQLKEYLLRNVDEADWPKVLEHFAVLTKECDPSEGVDEIIPDSVKTIRVGFPE